jgi:hypothetical protein
MNADPNIWSAWASPSDKPHGATVFMRQRNYGRDVVFVTETASGWWGWNLELRKPWVMLDGSWAFQYESGRGFNSPFTARDAADGFMRSVGLLAPPASAAPAAPPSPTVWDVLTSEAREGLTFLKNDPAANARFERITAFCERQNKENPIAQVTEQSRRKCIETALTHLIRGFGHEMAAFPNSAHSINLMLCIFNLEDELAAMSK